MNPTEPKGYDAAEFYTCRAPDLLSLTSPEEAIEEKLDGWIDDGDTEAAIRKYCAEHPVTVTGYSPRAIPDSVVKKLAEDTLERIDEYLGEDFGDPDGGGMFSKTAAEECMAVLLPAVRAACDRAKVWACEEVGTRTYSPDEVVTMMREHCPEWFES